MNYTLDLGFVAFENWWQVSAFTALIILYLILNVIPAIKTLLYCITNKEMILEAPLFCLAILVPIIGSIMGAIAWNENNLALSERILPNSGRNWKNLGTESVCAPHGKNPYGSTHLSLVKKRTHTE